MSIQDKKYEIDLTFEATAAKEGKTLKNPSLAFVIEDIMEADCGRDDCGCGKKDDCENCEKADCDCSSPESQAERAKSKTKKLEDHVALPVLKQKQIASDYSELWQKINKKEK